MILYDVIILPHLQRTLDLNNRLRATLTQHRELKMLITPEQFRKIEDNYPNPSNLLEEQLTRNFMDAVSTLSEETQEHETAHGTGLIVPEVCTVIAAEKLLDTRRRVDRNAVIDYSSAVRNGLNTAISRLLWSRSRAHYEELEYTRPQDENITYKGTYNFFDNQTSKFSNSWHEDQRGRVYQAGIVTAYGSAIFQAVQFNDDGGFGLRVHNVQQGDLVVITEWMRRNTLHQIGELYEQEYANNTHHEEEGRYDMIVPEGSFWKKQQEIGSIGINGALHRVSPPTNPEGVRISCVFGPRESTKLMIHNERTFTTKPDQIKEIIGKLAENSQHRDSLREVDEMINL